MHKTLKNPVLFLALFIAGGLFTFGAAPASAGMNSFVEAQVAVDLCSDYIINNKDDFSALKSRGYRVSKKRKGTTYRNGVGNVQLFGAPGIVIRKTALGCSVKLMGLKRKKGNVIFSYFQKKFTSQGYTKVGRGYLVKGNDKIKFEGVNRQGFIWMTFFRESK